MPSNDRMKSLNQVKRFDLDAAALQEVCDQIAEGYGVPRIAARYGVTKGRVRAMLVRHGLPTTSPHGKRMMVANGDTGELRAIIDALTLARMLRGGASTKVIGTQFGASDKQVIRACDIRDWPRPGRPGNDSFDYAAPGLEPLRITPAPPEGSLEATGGRYAKIVEWAKARDLPTAYAMQQWHRVRASGRVAA